MYINLGLGCNLRKYLLCPLFFVNPQRYLNFHHYWILIQTALYRKSRKSLHLSVFKAFDQVTPHFWLVIPNCHQWLQVNNEHEKIDVTENILPIAWWIIPMAHFSYKSYGIQSTIRCSSLVLCALYMYVDINSFFTWHHQICYLHLRILWNRLLPAVINPDKCQPMITICMQDLYEWPIQALRAQILAINRILKARNWRK